ncbi:MAG: hypothetical protein GXP34_03415 [Actinobacteria bacterium]|nr:hypothetical protein [Actinomycetota bacterium]
MKRSPFAEPVLHIDVDSFFVEIERRDDLSSCSRPVVVGGMETGGAVASVSHEAGANGVAFAMPPRVRRVCSDPAVLPVDHVRYREASGDVFSIFRSFTPLVEGVSTDEAFLDVSGLEQHHVGSEQVGGFERACEGQGSLESCRS